ncbi:MAG: UMP kinase [Phycisphaerales bacterium]|nr:UMP kinase [Phycisphaerales bacterium]
MSGRPSYTRVLLKISGESFAKSEVGGIDSVELHRIATEIAAVASSGVHLAVVVGGGNMIRGANLARRLQIDQSTADYMGMLGTVMNGMALKEALEHVGQPARLMSAISMPAIAEDFIRKRALRHMEKGRCIILAAGTGNPFFTTDTCASLRATELNCEVVLKATKVDGVYDCDPAKDPSAKRFDHLTFSQAIEDRLAVMDLTALSMCMEHDLPIIVFNFKQDGAIQSVVQGAEVGTLIDNSELASATAD